MIRVRSVVRTAAAWVVMGVSGSSLVIANPSHQKPREPIKPHGVAAELGDWATPETVRALYARADAMADQLESMTTDDLRRISPKRLMELHRGVWEAKQGARWLVVAGETAGHDLMRHFGSMEARVNELASRVGPTRAAMKAKTQAGRRLEKRHPARSKLGKQAYAAMQNPDRAEVVLDKLYGECADAAADVTFLSGKTRSKYWGSVLSPYEQAFGILSTRRRRAVQTATAEAAQRVLRSATEPPVAPQAGSPPGSPPGAGGPAGDGSPAGTDPLDSVDRWYRHYATSIQRAAALSDLAEVPLESGFDREAVGRTLVPMVRRASGDAVGEDVGRSLARLSIIDRRHGSLGLAEAWLTDPDEAYGEAVRPAADFLRRYYRRRAETMAGDGYRSAKQLMSQKQSPPEGYGFGWGQPNRRARFVAATRMTAPAFQMVGENGALVVGQKVVVEGVTRLSRDKRGGVTPVASGYYVNVLLPPREAVREASATGRRLLLIDDRHGPADAGVASAAAGLEGMSFTAVGGTIVRVQAESTATRMATLRPLAVGLIPPPPAGLVRYTDRTSGFKYSEAIVWRIDVRPDWYATTTTAAVMPTAD